MKKLYSSKSPNKRIHPSPPLSFLPSALMALASVLSPDDQLVLSYLLMTSHNQQRKNQNQNQNQNHDQNHSPDLGCSCFSCYKSFWARWDSSPNRHVIHTILDAFEEEETTLKYSKKKDGKGKSRKKTMTMKMKKEEEEEVADVDVVQEIDGAHHENEKTHDDGEDEKEEGDEKSSVRRFFGWVFGINN